MVFYLDALFRDVFIPDTFGESFTKVIPSVLSILARNWVRPVQKVNQVQTRARADTGRGHQIRHGRFCPVVEKLLHTYLSAMAVNVGSLWTVNFYNASINPTFPSFGTSTA